MGDAATLCLLLALLACAGLWLMASRARGRAIQEARWRCQQHGLQWLDESVGLSGLRVRCFHGKPVLKLRYRFEVSTDGGDRHVCHLWMIGSRVTALRLPPTNCFNPEYPAQGVLTAKAGHVLPFRRPHRNRDARL